jgi:hypothetical protein
MQVKSKKTLLLINSFNTHKLIVEMIEELGELTYIKIIWLFINIILIY